MDTVKKRKKTGARSRRKSARPGSIIGKSIKMKKTYDYYDFNLVAVIILIMCFGLIMLYSTSSYMAQVNWGNDTAFLHQPGCDQCGMSDHCHCNILHRLSYSGQVSYDLIRAFFIFNVSGTDSFWSRIPWSPADRLKIGIQFQPAEVAKIAVIVTLSYLIVGMGKKVQTLKATMVLFGVGGVQALVAYVFTDNLSTAMIIFGITFGLVFIAHPKTKPFVIIVAVAVVFVVILLVVLSNMPQSSNFRLRRIQVWLHPEDYASGDGYQTLQALYAIGSGGFFGRGLGNSIQKLGSVPEAQNDMIFSIICEELGIFGALMLLALFAYLLYRLFFIAQNAPDMFGSLLVSGVFVHIALQVIMNVAVVLNIMPNTGVTLPFISYGGTSVLFLMAEMGLALSVSRQIKFQEPEFIL